MICFDSIQIFEEFALLSFQVRWAHQFWTDFKKILNFVFFPLGLSNFGVIAWFPFDKRQPTIAIAHFWWHLWKIWQWILSFISWILLGISFRRFWNSFLRPLNSNYILTQSTNKWDWHVQIGSISFQVFEYNPSFRPLFAITIHLVKGNQYSRCLLVI